MHSLFKSTYSATNQEAAVTLVSRPFHARSESYTYRTENPRLVCNKLTFQTKLNFFVRSGLTCMKRHRLKLRSNFLCVKQTCPSNELFEPEKWLRYQMSWRQIMQLTQTFFFFFCLAENTDYRSCSRSQDWHACFISRWGCLLCVLLTLYMSACMYMCISVRLPRARSVWLPLVGFRDHVDCSKD